MNMKFAVRMPPDSPYSPDGLGPCDTSSASNTKATWLYQVLSSPSLHLVRSKQEKLSSEVGQPAVLPRAGWARLD